MAQCCSKSKKKTSKARYTSHALYQLEKIQVDVVTDSKRDEQPGNTDFPQSVQQGSVVQKSINANPRLKVDRGFHLAR